MHLGLRPYRDYFYYFKVSCQDAGGRWAQYNILGSQQQSFRKWSDVKLQLLGLAGVFSLGFIENIKGKTLKFDNKVSIRRLDWTRDWLTFWMLNSRPGPASLVRLQNLKKISLLMIRRVQWHISASLWKKIQSCTFQQKCICCHTTKCKGCHPSVCLFKKENAREKDITTLISPTENTQRQQMLSVQFLFSPMGNESRSLSLGLLALR